MSAQNDYTNRAGILWGLDEEKAFRRQCHEDVWRNPGDHLAQLVAQALPLDDDDLLAIEERARKATSGPWVWTERAVNAEIRSYTRRLREQYVYLLQGAPREDRFDKDVMQLNWYHVKGSSLLNVGPSMDDARFIASARTDVPLLVAEVRRLRALLVKGEG